MRQAERTLRAIAWLVAGTMGTATAEQSQETFIDIHFHADARQQNGGDLPRVAAWMKTNNVTRCVVLQFKKSLPRTEDERQTMIRNFRKYRGKISRFGVLFADDVSSQEQAVESLARMKKAGIIGFGEHYGEKRHFDDPACMRLYAACAELDLPVLFHMDGNNNKDDADLSHLENALQTHPDCVFIGHGPGFWAKMKVVDGLLGKYTNLYADISAGSGARAIGRDKVYSREFMARHQDRVLFGTDGGPWSFGKEPPPHFSLIKAMDLPEAVRGKICRHNAEQLFGFNAP